MCIRIGGGSYHPSERRSSVGHFSVCRHSETILPPPKYQLFAFFFFIQLKMNFGLKYCSTTMSQASVLWLWQCPMGFIGRFWQMVPPAKLSILSSNCCTANPNIASMAMCTHQSHHYVRLEIGGLGVVKNLDKPPGFTIPLLPCKPSLNGYVLYLSGVQHQTPKTIMYC